MNHPMNASGFSFPPIKLSGFTVPSFALPPALAEIGKRLPQWPHAIPLILALNTLRRLGAFDAAQMEALEGKHFRIRVTDAGTIADFSVRHGSFVPTLRSSGITPDLSFAASLSAYLQLLARQEDPDTLFFTRRLSIEGDTELSLHVKNMFDAIDFATLRERLPAPIPRALAALLR